MARVHCSKCGAKGWSKCPRCRSVFGSNESVLLETAEQFIRFRVKSEGDKDFRFEDGNYEVKRGDVIAVHMLHSKPGEKLCTRINVLSKILNGILEADELEQLMCDHVWDYEEGEVSDIGCGHT